MFGLSPRIERNGRRFRLVPKMCLRKLKLCVPGSIQMLQSHLIAIVAYQLYRQLLEPIEEIITQKKRLSFVFDGALTSLPPHVLITSDPGDKDLVSLDWLIRKYAVTVLPSMASLKVLRTGKMSSQLPSP